MALYGRCEWCGTPDDLRFVPGRADADDARPSICSECRLEAEIQLNEGAEGAYTL